MSIKNRLLDSMIRSTAAIGSLAGRILKDRPAATRGGSPKSKASRKTARRARRTTRRG
jgi:hypothetical protein